MSANAYVRRVLEDEIHAVRLAEPGARNEILYEAAKGVGRSLHAGDLTRDEVTEELLDAALVSGLSEEEARSTIRSGLGDGEQNPRLIYPAFRSREDVLRHIDEIEALAREAHWPGHAGKRKSLVLRGVIQIAREMGSITASISLNRLLTTIGSKNRCMAIRALNELVDDQWLQRISRGGPGRSARYRLTSPPSLRSRTPSTPSAQTRFHFAQSASLSHDAYRYRALDKAGWRIVDFLETNPGWHRQAHIARAIGISPNTVWRQCRSNSVAVSVGVIERSSTQRGAVRLNPLVTNEFLGVVAERLSTYGTGRAQQAGLRQWFENQGFLDEDGYWLDPATGDRRPYRADWLLNDPNAPRTVDQNPARPPDLAAADEPGDAA